MSSCTRQRTLAGRLTHNKVTVTLELLGATGLHTLVCASETDTPSKHCHTPAPSSFLPLGLFEMVFGTEYIHSVQFMFFLERKSCDSGTVSTVKCESWFQGNRSYCSVSLCLRSGWAAWPRAARQGNTASTSQLTGRQLPVPSGRRPTDKAETYISDERGPSPFGSCSLP